MAKNGAKTKASLISYNSGEAKYFMFNPPSFSDSKPIEYGVIKAPMGRHPRYIYQGTGEQTLEGLDLYYEGKPSEVRDMIIWLNDFIGFGNTLIFSWGGWYVKRLLLENLSVDYTMFDDTLAPIECTVHLQVKVVPTGMPPWEVSAGGY